MENDQKIFLLIDIERKYSHYRNASISHNDAGKKFWERIFPDIGTMSISGLLLYS